MESILTSIKKLLGIAEEYTHFDQDIIMQINSALFDLTQLGVGPSAGFSIDDAKDVWNDFIDVSRIEAVKTYVYLSVKLIFDPPDKPAVIDAYERRLKELEWRLNVAVDPAEA